MKIKFSKKIGTGKALLKIDSLGITALQACMVTCSWNLGHKLVVEDIQAEMPNRTYDDRFVCKKDQNITKKFIKKTLKAKNPRKTVLMPF